MASALKRLEAGGRRAVDARYRRRSIGHGRAVWADQLDLGSSAATQDEGHVVHDGQEPHEAKDPRRRGRRASR
jgi:hypothetical protein